MIHNEDEIQHVKFSVDGPEDIIRQSVVLIDSTDRIGDGSVYDTRMGPLNGEMCKTCQREALVCPGHFGHIMLNEPIINPIFCNRLYQMCGIFCHFCHRPVLVEKLPESLISLVNTKSRFTTCQYCLKLQPSITIDKEFRAFIKMTKTSELKIFPTADLLANMLEIDQDDVKALGLDQHPAKFIMTAFPVSPHLSRPSVSQGDQICDDDVTTQYLEIIKINHKLKGMVGEAREKQAAKLAFAIGVLFNNSKGKAKHPSSGRKIKGFAERLAGKEGHLRNNIQGRRCNQTARMVAAPGPTLDHGQIGVPRSIAQILTRPKICDLFNIQALQRLCDNQMVDMVDRKIDGKICEFGVKKFCQVKQTKLEPGDLILRFNEIPIAVETGREVLIEGDQIMRNSVPIVTKPASVRRFELKIGDIVHVHLQDGDPIVANRQPTLHTANMETMTAIITDDYCARFPLSITYANNMDFDGDEANLHVVQTIAAERELYKASARNTIISPSTGKPIATLVQDTTLALYLMTCEIGLVDDDLMDEAKYKHVERVRKKLNIATSRDTLALISTCLDSRLIVCQDDVQVISGVWISGRCDKQATLLLTKIVDEQFGHEATSDMLSNLQKMAIKWISRRGFTIDGNDIAPLNFDLIEEDARIRAEQGENSRTIRDAQHGYAVEETSMWKNIKHCIASGAKGNNINLGQIVACVGQQQGKTGRIEPVQSGNRIFVHDLIDNNFESLELLKHYGYVVSSFAQGLSPREYFMHAIPSRDAVVDTATGTANSGYLQHRVVKLLEDVFISNGQVVIKSSKMKTLALSYNNNLDPFLPRVNLKHENFLQSLYLNWEKRDENKKDEVCYRIDE